MRLSPLLVPLFCAGALAAPSQTNICPQEKTCTKLRPCGSGFECQTAPNCFDFHCIGCCKPTTDTRAIVPIEEKRDDYKCGHYHSQTGKEPVPFQATGKCTQAAQIGSGVPNFDIAAGCECKFYNLPDCTPQGAVGGMHIGPTKGNLPEGIKWYGCQFQRAARDASVGQVEGDFESAPAVERSVETLEERGGPPTLGCGPGQFCPGHCKPVGHQRECVMPIAKPSPAKQERDVDIDGPPPFVNCNGIWVKYPNDGPDAQYQGKWLCNWYLSGETGSLPAASSGEQDAVTKRDYSPICGFATPEAASMPKWVLNSKNTCTQFAPSHGIDPPSPVAAGYDIASDCACTFFNTPRCESVGSISKKGPVNGDDLKGHNIQWYSCRTLR